MLFPRFRSKERDLRSDVERLASIQIAVDRAVADAESERMGLATRLEDARSRAAFLYGDVIDGEVDGDRKSTALIADAERFLVRGERRREELEAHFAVLHDLQRRIGAAIQTLSQENIED